MSVYDPNRNEAKIASHLQRASDLLMVAKEDSDAGNRANIYEVVLDYIRQAQNRAVADLESLRKGLHNMEHKFKSRYWRDLDTDRLDYDRVTDAGCSCGLVYNTLGRSEGDLLKEHLEHQRITYPYTKAELSESLIR